MSWDTEVRKAQQRKQDQLNAQQAGGVLATGLGIPAAVGAADAGVRREMRGIGRATAYAGRKVKRDFRASDLTPGKKPQVITDMHPAKHLRRLGGAVGRRPGGALAIGGVAATAGGLGLLAAGERSANAAKRRRRSRKSVAKSLAVPWEITEVAKGTLGQTARMAAVGTKKAKAAGPPKQKGVPAWMAREKKGTPSWANRAPRDTGKQLSLTSNGFTPLTQKRKGDWKVPAGLSASLGTAAAVGGAYGHKKSVEKALSSTLGKPVGKLKPVTPPKPAASPSMAKPPTAPKPTAPMTTGAKPVGPKPTLQTAAGGPPATLRPPSMMPPKPGQQQKKPGAR